jgi:hypothetical protein
VFFPLLFSQLSTITISQQLQNTRYDSLTRQGKSLPSAPSGPSTASAQVLNVQKISPEVVRVIFTYLTAPDQVCFPLSCKYHFACFIPFSRHGKIHDGRGALTESYVVLNVNHSMAKMSAWLMLARSKSVPASQSHSLISLP